MYYSNYNELFIPISIDGYCKNYGVKNHKGMYICYNNNNNSWVLHDTINDIQVLIEPPYTKGDIFNPKINAYNRSVFMRFMGYKIMDVYIKYGAWCVRFDYYEYINKPPTIIITEENNNKFLKNNNIYHYF